MTSLPPKCFGQRDDAERDRHPRLDARYRILLVPDRARSEPVPSSRRRCRTGWRPCPFGSSSGEQPVTARRCFGLAIDHLEPDAGLGGHPVHEAVGIRRRAAGFGRDQPQAFGLLGMDLVAANAQGGDGAVDRGVADAAGRRDPLPEPDDARERVDHAKAVAGRTGDQQAAIVGAKVQRRVDAGRRRRRMAPPRARRCATRCRIAATRRALAVVSARRKALAKPRVFVHPKCLSAAPWGRRGISVHGNFSSAGHPRNSRSHATMPNQALSFRYRCVISGKPRKSR